MSYNKNHAQWLQKCRAVLIDMETKNIRQRALSWTEIVNAETRKINSMLGLNLADYGNGDNIYCYTVPSPLKYLTFLSEWSGIKTRNTSSQPTSYIEFESKAKNWLNGRRAPNYGNTLFPDMIKTSEQYSKHLASLVFGNIPINKLSQSPTSDALSNQYQKTLLFAYLYKLCTERIAVHQSWKKTNLLCENSVKNIHSNTAKLLQQYAIHDYTDNDLNSFPGSLQRSAAFFQEQHNRYLSRLMQSYNIYKNGHSNNNTNTNNNNMTRSTPSISGPDGNVNVNHDYLTNNALNQSNIGGVSMGGIRRMVDGRNPGQPVNYVAIKSSDYANIMERLAALERKHNSQAEQISTLTNKCQFLQHHIEAHSATNRIASISGGSVDQYDKLTSNEQYHRIQNNPVSSSSVNVGVNGITSSPSISHHSHHSSSAGAGGNDANSVNTGSTSHHSNHLQLPSITHSRSRPNTNSLSSHHQHTQPMPIPFNVSNTASISGSTASHNSHSLPPQLSLPHFGSSVVVTAASHNNNANEQQTVNGRKLDLSYNAPPAITALTASTSMPAIYNINNNANTTNTTPTSTHHAHHAAVGGYNPYEYGLTLQAPFTMYSNPNNNKNEHKYDHHHHHGHTNQTDTNNTDCTMNYLTSSTPNTSTNNLISFNNSSYLSDAMMLDHTSTPNTNNIFTFSPIN